MRLEGDPEKGSRLKETLEKWSGFTAWKLRSNDKHLPLSLVVEVVVFFGTTSWLVVGESNHSQKLKLSWKGVKSGWSYSFETCLMLGIYSSKYCWFWPTAFLWRFYIITSLTSNLWISQKQICMTMSDDLPCAFLEICYRIAKSDERRSPFWRVLVDF